MIEIANLTLTPQSSGQGVLVKGSIKDHSDAAPNIHQTAKRVGFALNLRLAPPIPSKGAGRTLQNLLQSDRFIRDAAADLPQDLQEQVLAERTQKHRSNQRETVDLLSAIISALAKAAQEGPVPHIDPIDAGNRKAA